MRYVGVVTDPSWDKALLEQHPEFRRRVLREESKKYNKKHEEGLDFIFSLGRLPRVYGNKYKIIS